MRLVSFLLFLALFGCTNSDDDDDDAPYDYWCDDFSSNWVEVAASENDACGITPQGTVQCIRYQPSEIAATGNFISITAGRWHFCGLSTDGAISCWTEGGQEEVDVPSGYFSSVSAGFYHTCAINIDGLVQCWGSNSHGQTNSTLTPSVLVSSGLNHSCAVTADGEIVCWGCVEEPPTELQSLGHCDPHPLTMSALSSGNFYNCGISDTNIHCWGCADNQTVSNCNVAFSAPSGGFVSVDAGHYGQACGVDTDENLECWGDVPVRCGAPDRLFSSVSVGGNVTCGITTEGTTICWGNLFYNEPDYSMDAN